MSRLPWPQALVLAVACARALVACLIHQGVLTLERPELPPSERLAAALAYQALVLAILWAGGFFDIFFAIDV
jgi:hypothetical protein